MMLLKEILNKKGGQPVTVSASATVADAIRAMHDHKVGSVVVRVVFALVVWVQQGSFHWRVSVCSFWMVVPDL